MSSAATPLPIIVGAPRSGTTLLRLMLDAHPDLAIPPETAFLAPLARLDGPDATNPRATVALMTRSPPHAPIWPDFGIALPVLEHALQALAPFSPGEAARTFYRLYAERHGKHRFGDKTPTYTAHIAAIGRLLPEARFIHLIRDGRDVAASLRRQWFAPGRDMASLARYWSDRVTEARRQDLGSDRYLEIRYEALVGSPEATLRKICDFVDLPFDGAMLRHHEHAESRLMEHRARFDSQGREIVSLAQRRAQQARTREPLDAALIRAWQDRLTADEVAEFEAAAGALLEELGYDRAPRRR
jgi:sulfotransferase family protein